MPRQLVLTLAVRGVCSNVLPLRLTLHTPLSTPLLQSHTGNICPKQKLYVALFFAPLDRLCDF